MPIKTILLHMANDDRHSTRLEVAVSLAKRFDAFVEVLYIATPVSMPAGATGRAASYGYIAESTVIAREKAVEVEQEVRQALLSFDNARSRVELADQSLKLAQDELELASDRFKAGVASSIEVDNAQTSLAAARDARIDALADAVQSRFDLARATGEIRGMIPEKNP